MDHSKLSALVQKHIDEMDRLEGKWKVEIEEAKGCQVSYQREDRGEARGRTEGRSREDRGKAINIHRGDGQA
jgi:hypothetical protein